MYLRLKELQENDEYTLDLCKPWADMVIIASIAKLPVFVSGSFF
jgi:hypothetical protein